MTIPTAESAEAQPPGEMLVHAGLTAADEILDQELKARHRLAWLLRLSHVAPAAAREHADQWPDTEQRRRLREAILTESARAEDGALNPEFDLLLAEAASLPPGERLHLLNSLCEAAIQVGTRDEARARALIGRLLPGVRSLKPESGSESETHADPQVYALGCALFGEALAALNDPAAGELLDAAEAAGETLMDPDPLRAFLVGTFVEHDAERAVGLAGRIYESGTRLDLRLQLLRKVTDPGLREALLTGAERDAATIEHMRGAESLVRVGQALAALCESAGGETDPATRLDPARARDFFERAIEHGRACSGQMRALQWTGVAGALATVDAEWSSRVFSDALDAAHAEPELERRVVSLVVIAMEMAAGFPRRAAEIFAAAMQAAEGLSAMWEMTQVLELIFEGEASPFLDLSPARPLVERVLDRVADEDVHVPGVFNALDAARILASLDREAGATALATCFDRAAAAKDSEAMTGAALQLHRFDPERGLAAIRRCADLLLERVDCPAMGAYARDVAHLDPEAVLLVAAAIPDRREQADAVTAAACALSPTEPARAVQLILSLERPQDRSAGLMALFDQLPGVPAHVRPAPALQDLP